jgi:hypothetical protein
MFVIEPLNGETVVVKVVYGIRAFDVEPLDGESVVATVVNGMGVFVSVSVTLDGGGDEGNGAEDGDKLTDVLPPPVVGTPVAEAAVGPAIEPGMPKLEHSVGIPGHVTYTRPGHSRSVVPFAAHSNDDRRGNCAGHVGGSCVNVYSDRLGSLLVSTAAYLAARVAN